MRSQGAQDDEQLSQSPSESSSAVSLSVRNPTPKQLLTSSLEQASAMTEAEVQAAAKTFRAPHTETSIFPNASAVTHTHRDTPARFCAPDLNVPSYAYPTGKAPILSQDYHSPTPQEDDCYCLIYPIQLWLLDRFLRRRSFFNLTQGSQILTAGNSAGK
jgi:hypothetical protein